jgi:excisionase family DNA binding protein
MPVSLVDAQPSGRVVLTLAEVAARLGLHRQTVVAAIQRGQLPAVRIGRQWLIPVCALDRVLSPTGEGSPAAQP